MVYKRACLNTYFKLLLLHSAFMLSMVKMPLKGDVGGHGNYIADHGKSWKNHGIVFLNFCGNPGHSAPHSLNARNVINNWKCNFKENIIKKHLAMLIRITKEVVSIRIERFFSAFH